MAQSFLDTAWFGQQSLPATGCHPVGVQGRRALPAGGYRREVKQLHKQK